MVTTLSVPRDGHVERPDATTGLVDVSRWLGAMFLLVIVTSFASGILIASAAGTGSISDVLAGVAGSPVMVRLGVLLGFATSLAIVALAVLLFVVLRGQAQVLALVALGWWLAEAIVLAVARAGDAALIGLAQSFVAAGSPGDSHYQALASFLYTGLDKGLGSTTHMLFYCAGGLIWYGLFLGRATCRGRSRPLASSPWRSLWRGASPRSSACRCRSSSTCRSCRSSWSIGIWLLVRGIGIPEDHKVTPLITAYRP